MTVKLVSHGYDFTLHEGVTKSFRIGRLELELQMVQLSGTKYSCIAILWVSLVSFAASQRLFIVVSVYFVIDSVRKFWVHSPNLNTCLWCISYPHKCFGLHWQLYTRKWSV